MEPEDNLGLPRETGDELLEELQSSLSYKLRQSVWQAYEAHLNSLRFQLQRPQTRKYETGQLEEIVTLIALAAYNRLILLQMRGFAAFGNKLIKSYDAKGLTLGSTDFTQHDFTALHELAIAFQTQLQVCGIPKYMLEYPDVPTLLSMYDQRQRTQ